MDLIDSDLRDAVLYLPKTKVYIRSGRYDDEEFRQRFRLTKLSFSNLLDQLKEVYEDPKTNRGLPITLNIKLASFLPTLATNCFQLSTADHLDISQASVSRIFHEILDILFALREEFIFWPGDEENKQISRRFFTKTGIPGIVGCIDGSLIKIKAPTRNEHEFVCRKGFHAINMAAVCDDRHLFRWVNSSYPGSAADCRIFNESHLKSALDDKTLSGCLLGDSGY